MYYYITLENRRCTPTNMKKLKTIIPLSVVIKATKREKKIVLQQLYSQHDLLTF